MAIVPVNSGQSAGTAASSLAIASATAGNRLNCFISLTAEAVKPTVTDNLGGTWTVEEAHGETTSAANSIWFAWKQAAGGETEIKVTPAGTSVSQGLSYLEVSGADMEPPEHIQATGKQASATAHASPEITTSNSGDLIFIAMGVGGTFIEVESWNNEMTNIASTSARCPGGYYVAPGTLAAKVFTATLKVAKGVGMLAVAIKAASGAPSFSGTIANNMALTQSVAGNKRAASATTQQLAMPQALAGSKIASGSIVNRLALVYSRLVARGVGHGSASTSLALAVNTLSLQTYFVRACQTIQVSLTLWPGATEGATAKLKAVIYSTDAEGKPLNLIAEGTEVTYTPSQGQKTIGLPVVTHLTGSQLYAIGFLLGGEEGAVLLRYDETSKEREVHYTASRAYAEGAPASAPAMATDTKYLFPNQLVHYPDDMGWKIDGGVTQQLVALVQKIIGEVPGAPPVFSGTVSQLMALRQSISGSKVTAGAVTQREALVQTAIGRKVAGSAVTQQLSMRSVLGAGQKRAVGTSVQTLAVRNVLGAGVKRVGSAILQRLGLRQKITAPLPPTPEEVFAWPERITAAYAKPERVGKVFTSGIRRTG